MDTNTVESKKMDISKSLRLNHIHQAPDGPHIQTLCFKISIRLAKIDIIKTFYKEHHKNKDIKMLRG